MLRLRRRAGARWYPRPTMHARWKKAARPESDRSRLVAPRRPATATMRGRLGPYEILAPIGSGGMGEVYRARDRRLNRLVAIKVLSASYLERPDARMRFEREARAVAALHHPHICALYDIGHDAGVDFLVMPYLEGETLAARLT